MKRIVLASASPRRKELLEQIGITFEIRTYEAEETYTKETPAEIVKELALSKAQHVWDILEDKESVVIGADTIVVSEGKILGKPKDAKEAFLMIRSLEGRSHQVYTGVAIRYMGGPKEVGYLMHAEETKVYVKHMDEAEIWAYISTGEPFDKAGGYGIQGRFAPYIPKIEGDYYNVVGLPVSYVYDCLKSVCGWRE